MNGALKLLEPDPPRHRPRPTCARLDKEQLCAIAKIIAEEISEIRSAFDDIQKIHGALFLSSDSSFKLPIYAMTCLSTTL